jgi:hypothetical protein
MSISSISGSYNSYYTQESTGIGTDSQLTSFELTSSDTKTEEKKTAREIEKEKTAEEIEAFFASMKKAGSALAYVVESNLEKIKKLIEEKKEELKKANGFYSEPPLSPEKKAELMKGIEEALAEYQKELIKELEEKSKAEKEAKQQGAGLKTLLNS